MTVSLDEQLATLFDDDPRVLADPYPLYRELRERGPAYRFGPAVLVSHHPEARDALRDGVKLSVRAKVDEGTYGQAERARRTAQMSEAEARAADAVIAFQGLVMSRNDGDTHARLRGVAHRSMTARALSESVQTIQHFTDELLAPMAGDHVTDFREFAFRLPVTVITAMLGLSAYDDAMIHSFANMRQRAEAAGSALGARQLMEEWRSFADDFVARHELDPEGTPPLAAKMVEARQADLVSTDELSAMVLNLIFAGHETTTNLICIGMYELLRHPEQWRLLCDDPARAGDAIEELLRFVTPVQVIPRVAVEPYRVGDLTVEPGETLIVMIAAANRDPGVFDRPEELDIQRPERKDHLSLGLGPHFCVGAAVARNEARIALETLARRFPEIELVEDSVEWAGNHNLRTLARLPVRLGRDYMTSANARTSASTST